MDQNIQNYINQQKASGKTDEQIKQLLLQNGWSQAQVNEAFGIPNPTAGSLNSTPPPPAGQPAQGVSNNKVMAIISYIGILWIVPLFTESKNDPFVKYHIKQGIVLSIAGIAIWAIGRIIPFFGFFIGILDIGLLVLTIMGIINAANGKQAPVPIIGSWASSLKF